MFDGAAVAGCVGTRAGRSFLRRKKTEGGRDHTTVKHVWISIVLPWGPPVVLRSFSHRSTCQSKECREFSR